MYSRSIEFSHGVVRYDVQGLGSRALLLFHGAGQDRSVFNQIPSQLSAKYRLYAFDLFFHGESEWRSDLALSKSEWRSIILKFAEDEQVEHWTVLGYSIGARFALATLETCPEQTHGCFLVAPDGIPSSPWFNTATQTILGRTIFKACMQAPSLMEHSLSLAVKVGSLDQATARFIEHQLNTGQKRQRVYAMWITFRNLRFRKKILQQLINSYHTPVRVYLAARDGMINEKPIRRFLKRLKSAHLEVIDSNHRRILNESLERIARL